MAQIHLQHGTHKFMFACFRRTKMGSGMSEVMFIDRYTKANGKNFCSKCADVLIKQGKLTMADNTIPQDLKLVIQKVATGTELLRVEYMEKTEEFAKRKFKSLEEESNKPISYWYNRFSVPMKTRKDHTGKEHLSPDYGKEYYKMERAREIVLKEVKLGYDVFLKNEIERATRHYDDSVRRLSERILEKSLNIQKLKVTSGHVGVNIETTITDGINVVSAWTIIAEGPIVRPHYRYLVK